MKKTLIILTILLSQLGFGQAKSPKLMVMPADIYCTKKGFTYEFDNQGHKETVSDYENLFKHDENVRQVISKIEEMIMARGYRKIEKLEMALKKIKQTSAELSVMRSKNSDAPIKESPIDIIKNQAKADIIIDVDFDIKTSGVKKYIHFNLQAYDAYSNQPVGNVSGDGPPGFSTTPGKLIEEAVLSHMDNFLDQLQAYFDDLFEKGRYCAFQVRMFSDADIDLEEEYNVNGEDTELKDFIEDWFTEHSVKGRSDLVDDSENFAKFEARIPLFDKKGRAINARKFLKGLKKALKKAPFNLNTKLYNRGLGEAWLIIK